MVRQRPGGLTEAEVWLNTVSQAFIPAFYTCLNRFGSASLSDMDLASMLPLIIIH